MRFVTHFKSFFEIAQSVREGSVTAEQRVALTLDDIQHRNDRYNCFTRLFADESIAAARVVDRKVAAGENPGVLAGVPFGVKDLFDVAGYVTTAGAKLRTNAPVVKKDAVAIQRLKAAGAILIGTLNMDEFAYGFATVNSHFGTTRNPHDPSRLAGGSSGGSAAAVAAGLVPLTLGSDTNGSVRVPAALCGLWGIRPADGAIPVEGTFPFAEILDTVGPFTRTSSELAAAYQILSQSPDWGSSSSPRVARLGGWFANNASDEVTAAIDHVMSCLGTNAIVEMPEAETARSASFLITAAQGGALHLETLRIKAMEYDPAVRDRLLAGAMLPTAIYLRAMAYRKYFRAKIKSLFEQYDILIAPTTPMVAPSIDDATIWMDGKAVSARAHLGIYTQPLSLAGIPVVSTPYYRPHALPIGLQFATTPGREAMLFKLLHELEKAKVVGSSPPPINEKHDENA